jgi:alpha-glucosidase
LLLTLRGTAFLFQGEELGLPDARVRPEEQVDVDGRDPERAPLPWEPPSLAGPGAGFTSGTPWLPLVEQAEDLAVSVQRADPRSALALHRRIIGLRRATPALHAGGQRMVDAGPEVLAWIREDGGEAYLVALNMSSRPRRARGPRVPGRLVLPTDPDRPGDVALDPSWLELGADEGVLVQLERAP